MKPGMFALLAAWLILSQTACVTTNRSDHGEPRQVSHGSSGLDSDGDSVADEAERRIGTDPNRRDYDTDNDGVPNYLEYHGYTYNRRTGKFVLWNGDPKVRHWRTDPTQWSTDQDPFPDGMEASGALMDVAVQKPGDDPLVPAYPNIVVRLESYAVTLNEDISYTDGGSLAKGSTWNREASQTSSQSTARAWEAGVAVKVGVSLGPKAALEGVKAEVEVHANYGETYTSTQTTSTAVSVGKSVLDESNWSRARATNPTRAAQLKLRLKVHNYGTACASNIVPTLTLRIGGINVATFQPGNSQVNMLPPGGQYPPGKGVYWVVDSVDTGTGVTPLYLTLDELRALERGAPVSLTVTQLKADVMLRNRSGEWTNAGDCSEYLARCEAAGANIQIEIGKGSFVHHLVYADDAPSAPRVTLRDGLTSLGVGADGRIQYQDTQGIPQVASIDGYTFVFDQETLRRNGWDMNVQPAAPPAGKLDIADMVLGPRTSVLIRSPRKSSEPGPTIHYANADPRTRVVQACVSDYDGIGSVQFLDKEGQPFEKDEKGLPLVMREDIPGSGFFNLVVPQSHYVFDGTEKVIVTNLAKQKAERCVDVVYYAPTPQPEKPAINAVGFRYQAGKLLLYANVTNPTPDFPIRWVKVFSPHLEGGAIEMKEPPNAYEDPNGWTAGLPSGYEKCEDLKVVAYIQPGVYGETVVRLPKEGEEKVTTYAIATKYDWTGTKEWWTKGLDLDTETEQDSHWRHAPIKFGGNAELTHWCTTASRDQWRLNFTVPFVKVDKKDQPFDSIVAGLIKNLLGATGRNRLQEPGDYTYEKGDIFLFRTGEGRLAKLRIEDWTDKTDRFYQWHRRELKLRCVVYQKEK